VPGSEPGGLGSPRIHHPQPAACRELLEPGAGAVHGDVVAVGDRRVGAEHEDELGVLVVRSTAESRRSPDEVGNQGLRRAIDGQRTELRCRPDRLEQRLGRAVAGRVHPDPAAQEERHRVRAVLGHDLPHPVREVGQAGLPRRGCQCPFVTHQRVLEPVGMVVQLRQRAPLRTGVSTGDGMFTVPAHTEDRLAVGLDQDPAHAGADPAEAADDCRTGLRGHRGRTVLPCGATHYAVVKNVILGPPSSAAVLGHPRHRGVPRALTAPAT
jgi:hypothetical protein